MLYRIPRRPAERPKPAFDAVSRTPMPRLLLFRSRMLMVAHPSSPVARPIAQPPLGLFGPPATIVHVLLTPGAYTRD
jgi:hypothetical protein